MLNQTQKGNIEASLENIHNVIEILDKVRFSGECSEKHQTMIANAQIDLNNARGMLQVVCFKKF